PSRSSSPGTPMELSGIRPSLTSLPSHHGGDVRQIDGNNGGVIEQKVERDLKTAPFLHQATRGCSTCLVSLACPCEASARVSPALPLGYAAAALAAPALAKAGGEL